MIIPIRCFTCGKVLADKWEYYSNAVKEINEKNDDKEGSSSKHKDGNAIFQELGIHKICCRRHFLTHIDLIEKI